MTSDKKPVHKIANNHKRFVLLQALRKNVRNAFYVSSRGSVLRVLENHVKNKKNEQTTIRFLYGDGHTVQRMPGFVEHLGR